MSPKGRVAGAGVSQLLEVRTPLQRHRLRSAQPRRSAGRRPKSIPPRAAMDLAPAFLKKSGSLEGPVQRNAEHIAQIGLASKVDVVEYRSAQVFAELLIQL